MSRIFITSFILLIASAASAVTQTTFLPGDFNAMAYVRGRTMDGQSDNDLQTLWNEMTVPPQNSMLGPGKPITTTTQDFNMTCSLVQGLCSIILNHSDRVKILFFKKIMSFTATGAEADRLGSQFELRQGEYHFLSTDRKMRITATPGFFEFLVSESGIQ